MGSKIIAGSSGLPNNPNMFMILLDSSADAESLATEYAFAAPGSMAISADLGYQAIKGPDGAWHQRAVIEATSAATAAAEAAGAAAEAADAAKERANTAAEGAEAYATQYTNVVKDISLDNADVRMLTSIFQALIRAHEKRITTLESQVAAMVGA